VKLLSVKFDDRKIPVALFSIVLINSSGKGRCATGQGLLLRLSGQPQTPVDD
jgi:hypothetical protein